MKRVIKKVNKLVKNCLRCGHTWLARMLDDPKACPRCKSFNWNKANNNH